MELLGKKDKQTKDSIKCSCNPCLCHNTQSSPLLGGPSSSCKCSICSCNISSGENTKSNYVSVIVEEGILTKTVDIEGMTCSSCVASIQDNFAKKSGIISTNVNLITSSAQFKYDADKISIKEIVNEINNMGFEARVSENKFGVLKLDIEGMTCSSCSAALESNLKTAKGIKSIFVNLIQNNCVVEYSSDIIGPREIIQIIEDIGYGAKIVKEEKKNEQEIKQQKELLKYKRLFFISLIFSIPTFLLSMVFMMIPSLEHYFMYEIVDGLDISSLILLTLATPVQFILGSKFYIGAYKSLRNGSANMDVLIALGTSAAYFYSLVAIILNVLIDFEGTMLFETSVLLITFVFLGKFLEVYAKGKTSEALTKLLSLRGTTATLVTFSKTGEIQKEENIESDLIQKGDILKVAQGERVPVDGVVFKGEGAIDESMITGESIPVPKAKGDKVIGSTISVQGHFYVEATNVGSETTLSKIIKLVEDAQTNKAPIQAVADQISKYFVPTVIFISIMTFIIWYSLSLAGVLPKDYIPEGLDPVVFCLLFSIAVLVIACPCALGLATPTAVMVGTGVAAKHGILIKGGSALEKSYTINAIIFDKTGTLTQGKPVVTDVKIFGNLTYQELSTFASSIESYSVHPLAKSVVQYFHSQVIIEMSDIEEKAGLGIRAKFERGIICGGNEQWMNNNGCFLDHEQKGICEKLQQQGKTAILFCLNGGLIGITAVADVPREESGQVVKELESKGIEVWMVTGDNIRTATAVANQIGIVNIFAGVLPDQKSEKVKSLQSQGKRVCMIGDGINDSPALAVADVSIAIGAGTDVAMETASIVLVKSNLWDVLTAIDLSKKVFNRIKLNFLWAFGYNVIGIPVAAGLFYPLIQIQFPPYLAALAMTLSSVSVILSSLWLKNYNDPYSAQRNTKMEIK